MRFISLHKIKTAYRDLAGVKAHLANVDEQLKEALKVDFVLKAPTLSDKTSLRSQIFCHFRSFVAVTTRAKSKR